MAPMKYNGGGGESLLPERRGGGSSNIFAGVVRRRKLSRFIFSKRTNVWIWMSFLLFALFFVSFSVFGLKFQLPGNFERFERLNNGRVSGGGGDKMSETTQIVSGSVNVNMTVFVPPPNEVKKQGFIGSYTNNAGTINPPKSKSKKHHPCEVNFTESVNYLIEPQDVRNFTQFSLHYVAAEEKPSVANSFKSGFGGHQTLAEREKSFYARDQTLHCGFVKGTSGFPSTGFDLDEKDRAYMSTCQVVVSSCIFGSSDFLRRPTSIKISEFSKQNVCFVMFVDENTQSKLASDGHVPDDRGQVGLWKIVVVRNLPYEDMRRTGKVPKFLSHRLFPSARYSIWLDSKMRLNTDPMLILEYFLWRTKSEYAISNHYDRHCVWDEVLQNKRLNKYNHTAIDEQFNFYRSDGLTKFDSSSPNTLLPSYVPEGSFIVRAHTPMSNLLSCLWFNEVNRFTSRDQLSFAYTYLKLRRLNPDRPFYLNMFKDCERRALAKLFRHRTLPSTPSRP